MVIVERMRSVRWVWWGAGVVLAAVAAIALVVWLRSDDIVVLSADDSEVTVEVGERFRIDVRANASIGNQWRVERQPDPTVAQLVAEDYDHDARSGDADGAGGTRSYELEAVAAGSTVIELYDCYQCTSQDEYSSEPEARSVVIDILVVDPAS